MSEPVWQAVPQDELIRTAERLQAVCDGVQGVLHTSFQWELNSLAASVRYLVEQSDALTAYYLKHHANKENSPDE